MKLIEPHVTIVDKFNANELVRKIELAARTCYQSNDDKKTEHSTMKKSNASSKKQKKKNDNKREEEE